ncbi:hypothetical protein I546_3815 [Mycobacterium kansasii 732]|nr:hypothetical protein I546_3815 [Mycobacterium kansasii 732]
MMPTAATALAILQRAAVAALAAVAARWLDSRGGRATKGRS